GGPPGPAALRTPGGTDHGAAAPMFLIGSQIVPGVHGAHPSLVDLDQGDLRFQVDFRSVYATVLEQWLGISSQAILGDRFPAVGILRPRARLVNADEFIATRRSPRTAS